ncbi:MAG: putative 7-carboxy-7-deazaguanine synthase QueE [Eubacteriales bacterium]|nr:putative 7-carboxy-7-deazaguanine synthase QueE [Eubacteriales bacterium]
MRVVEKFVSINGEGRRAGELAVFIRFQGCDLHCSYCDTQWANQPDCPYEELSPAAIAAYVASTGVHDVTLTGGEPLRQPAIGQLIELLVAQGQHVEVETNGATDIRPFLRSGASFTVDYKCPSSGCEARMVPDNFAHVTARDTVKFVVGSTEDLDKAAAVIARYQLDRRCAVYLSPVFGQIEPEAIVQYMIAHRLNGIRLQIQLHKVIWHPDKRGV